MPLVVLFERSAPPARRRPPVVASLNCAAALVAALAAPLPARAEVRPVGLEVAVAAPAGPSSVAVGADAGFAVAWRTRDGEHDGTVWLQRFAPDDRPLGPPRFVGGDRAARFYGPSTPALGMAADGSLVVAWTGPGNHVPTTIQVRLFDAEGLPRGPAFRVSGGLEAVHPKLAVAADGSFAVGWTGLTGFNPDAYARRFAADGTPAGERFLVHQDTFRDQLLGGLALAPDGRLAAAFDSWEGEGSFFDVLLSLFAADGTPELLDQRVNVDPEVLFASQYEGTVVRLADGRWLLAWAGPAPHDGGFVEHAVWARWFDAAGQPLGPEVVLPEVLTGEQRRPAVAPLPDGGFVALWNESCPVFADCDPAQSHRDGDLGGVFGRAFDAAGQPAGGDFQVPADGFGDQAHAAVAAGPAGDVVATWTETLAGSEAGGSVLVARRFAAPCEPGPHTLCLGGRVRAEVEWRDFFGNTGAGAAEARDDLWGTFWFFDPENLEVAVKLIDGTPLNAHLWVFYGALSNVEYDLRVTDTHTGRVASYHNPAGTFASRGDTQALPVFGWPPAAPQGARAAGGGAMPGPVRPAATTDRPFRTGAAAETAPCQPAADRLCLLDGRFAAEIDWQEPSGGAGRGLRLPLTDDTGAFWFFRGDNPEVVVKVLDARTVNGRFWVFFGSLTDVAFRLHVTDTATGERRIYENPQGNFASRGDTAAFPVAGGG